MQTHCKTRRTQIKPYPKAEKEEQLTKNTDALSGDEIIMGQFNSRWRKV